MNDTEHDLKDEVSIRMTVQFNFVFDREHHPNGKPYSNDEMLNVAKRYLEHERIDLQSDSDHIEIQVNPYVKSPFDGQLIIDTGYVADRTLKLLNRYFSQNLDREDLPEHERKMWNEVLEEVNSETSFERLMWFHFFDGYCCENYHDFARTIERFLKEGGLINA